jgi:hypothetical protein
MASSGDSRFHEAEAHRRYTGGMRSHFFPFLRQAAIFLLPTLIVVPACFGWGKDGHMIINRIAAEKLPADVPAFLRSPEAINEIEYLGPEPDRWRSPAEPELNSAQAPEHFIDLEIADRIGPLPRKRFDFIAALYATAQQHPEWATDLRPEHVGLQPYVTVEVFERLKAAMREYRTLSAKHEDTKPVEQAIIFYAGWLGHYVADGSMPLHVTVNHDGWVNKENPNGYTTQHEIHALFESAFVSANLHAADVAPLVGAPKELSDPFTDYLAYLRSSATQIERVYQLEKAKALEGAGTPESRQYVAERLAAGSIELRDLIYTAWLESAKAVPEWHPAAPKAEGAGLPAGPKS